MQRPRKLHVQTELLIKTAWVVFEVVYVRTDVQ